MTKLILLHSLRGGGAGCLYSIFHEAGVEAQTMTNSFLPRYAFFLNPYDLLTLTE